MKLDAIKAFDVEEFLKYLRREGGSRSRLTQCRGMLFQIFHKAEANDLVHKNPVRFGDKMRNLNPTTEKDCFTVEEVKLLMANLPQDRIGASIRLMLGTGMRTQEILALEPRHIEEDGSAIHICQAINMVGGMAEVGIPKSRDSYRDIPVPPVLRPYALYLRNRVEKYIWESDKVKKPVNPTYFRKLYKAELDKIGGVRYLSPHSC
jgi:integrase